MREEGTGDEMASDGTHITPWQERYDWIIRRYNETQTIPPTYFGPDGLTDAVSDIGHLLRGMRDLEEIVKAVAAVADADYDEACPFCREQPGYTNIEHTSDCPVTKARALFGKSE